MRLYLSIIVLCFIAIGCNSDPRCRRETALLRAEFLDLEDKYYLLKSQRDSAIAELNADGNTELAQRIFPTEMLIDPASGGIIYDNTFYEDGVIYEEGLAPGATGNVNGAPYDYAPYDYSPADTLPIDSDGGLKKPPGDAIELDSRESIFPRESIEPIPARDAISSPSSSLKQSNSRLRLQARASKPSKSNSARSSSLVKTNLSKTDVTGITIHRGETRGHDVDGQPGDEGLNVLLQTKTANGETVLETGELTVSVIDPAAPSASQRIGLWKFLPDETALFFTKAPNATRGILLHLPWDQITPRGSQVVVFARFQTNDGRRLETSAPVRITPSTRKIPDSTPADGKQPLIADWKDRDSSRPTATNDNRQKTPAIPASTGASRISKPAWRPVR